MHDQAYHLRNLKLQSTLSDRDDSVVIAVVGSKGGVGTTSLMMAIGRQLAAERYHAALTCWGSRFSDLCALCGLEEPSAGPGSATSRVVCDERLSVLLADVTCHDADDAAARLLVSRLVDGHAADVLLVDLGADLDAARSAFCAVADATIVATTADNLAIMDAYAMVKCLSQHAEVSPAGIQLLVNQVTDVDRARSASQRLIATSRRFLNVHLPSVTLLPLCDVSYDNHRPLEGELFAARLQQFSAHLLADIMSRRKQRQRCDRERSKQQPTLRIS